MFLAWLLFIFSFEHHVKNIEAGNVIIFPMMSRSQLLSAARFASILSRDGHNVTIIIPTNDEKDIKKSPEYNFLYYKTSVSREVEQAFFKEAPKFTPKNFLLGKVSMTMPNILAARCSGLLFDIQFQNKMAELNGDVAIVQLTIPCDIPLLNRMGIPFLDFCSVTLMHTACGYPHRIPSPPSFVPDGTFSEEPRTFFGRVINTMVWLALPKIIPKLMLSLTQKELYKYQKQHGLPYEDVFELRSKASFLLVHGDVTFETVRPSMPKVVYIGGIQCDVAKPLQGDLHDFVTAPGDFEGLIIFSLGGLLNTQGLPDRFIETFLNIFRRLPYRVVLKLTSVPPHLQKLVPNNVKVVDWMPQQDLLGHPKTKLFVSHGGIQGCFESICHGMPTLGVVISADQAGNMKILRRKGMALTIDDYTTMTESEVDNKIHQLLSDPDFATNAANARTLYNDQPLTAAKRLAFAVGYTIRHKGAHHVTSDAAMQLYWFQYYLLDVYLFLCGAVVLLFCVGYLLIKLCFKCCICIYKGREKSKSD